jgi:hypothetical protein
VCGVRASKTARTESLALAVAPHRGGAAPLERHRAAMQPIPPQPALGVVHRHLERDVGVVLAEAVHLRQPARLHHHQLQRPAQELRLGLGLGLGLCACLRQNRVLVAPACG